MKFLLGVFAFLTTVAFGQVQVAKQKSALPRLSQEEFVQKVEEMTAEEKNFHFDQLTTEATQMAQSGLLDDAISTCEKSLLVKEHSSSYYLLSQIYLSQAKHGEALKNAKKALALEPENKSLQSSVKFHQGVLSQDAMQFADALKRFKEAAALCPKDDVITLEKVAIAIAALGDVPTTSNLLKQIWKASPHHKFHNALPFVRLVDKFENDLEHSSTHGDQISQKHLSQLSNITTITSKVWMDIVYDGGEPKRVVFGLYGFAAPRTVRNFMGLANCDKGPKYCYRGVEFHRIMKGFIMQGGDIGKGDGSGTVNVYDRPFADEIYGLILMHASAGTLSMANSGENSNGGQFVIMADSAPHLNGNHVVFGKVLEGLEYALEANLVEVDARNRPLTTVAIHDCGIVYTEPTA